MVFAYSKVKGVKRMAKLVLATHGGLSLGMADSLKMIIGDLTNNLEIYSLIAGENPEDYAKKKREEIERTKETHIFVTDILGGSVHTALMQLTQIEQVFVISGMNMALVMELLFALKDDITYQDIMKIIKDARAAINCIQLNYESEIQEDF